MIVNPVRRVWGNCCYRPANLCCRRVQLLGQITGRAKFSRVRTRSAQLMKPIAGRRNRSFPAASCAEQQIHIPGNALDAEFSGPGFSNDLIMIVELNHIRIVEQLTSSLRSLSGV